MDNTPQTNPVVDTQLYLRANATTVADAEKDLESEDPKTIDEAYAIIEKNLQSKPKNLNSFDS